MKYNFSSDVQERVDSFINNQTDDLSRNKIQKLILDGKVMINGIVNLSKKKKLNEGDVVEIDVNLTPSELKPISGWDKIEIINETEDFIIINKPTGLVVHPGAGNTENTLVNMLIAKYKDLPNSDTDRPGIVHRIDKDTSGVMIIAKTNKFYQNIIVQFENREIEKTYVAILEGNPEKRNGMINLPLGRDTNDRTKQTVTKVKSKEAVSIYHTLQEFEKHSLVEFKILTGRTHQIRVHAQYMGNSVLNDPIYSKKHMAEYKEFGQFLHAKAISFKNLAGEEVVFTTEEPTTFTDVLKNL